MPCTFCFSIDYKTPTNRKQAERKEKMKKPTRNCLWEMSGETESAKKRYHFEIIPDAQIRSYFSRLKRFFMYSGGLDPCAENKSPEERIVCSHVAVDKTFSYVTFDGSSVLPILNLLAVVVPCGRCHSRCAPAKATEGSENRCCHLSNGRRQIKVNTSKF